MPSPSPAKRITPETLITCSVILPESTIATIKELGAQDERSFAYMARLLLQEALTARGVLPAATSANKTRAKATGRAQP